MATDTNIEWCDSTFNPWIGCTKVGPGCDHCYAEVSTPSRTRGILWGQGSTRQRTSETNWKLPLRWNAESLLTCDCGYRGTLRQMTTNSIHACGEKFRHVRRRVFCASLADWLDNEVPIEWLVDLLDLIRRTPNLDWLLLTKRIGNFHGRIQEAYRHALQIGNLDLGRFGELWLKDSERSTPKIVWIGATVVNQPEYDRDVGKLLLVPARVHFLSIEPMLGHIELGMSKNGPAPGGLVEDEDGAPYPGTIDWVITGGESGHHARPIHPHWVMSLRDQCTTAGVPLLFKQWGEWVPRSDCYHTREDGSSFADADPGCELWPSIRLTEAGHDGRQLDHVDGGCDVYMQRVGKKLAGNLLQGRQHLEWPA